LLLENKYKFHKNFLLNYILIDKNVSFDLISSIVNKSNDLFDIELKTISVDDMELNLNDNFD